MEGGMHSSPKENRQEEQKASEGNRGLGSGGAQEPVAWAVTIGTPGDLSVYEAFADHQKDEAISLARECLFCETNRPLPLAPLYFAPTLTYKEREAIAAGLGALERLYEDAPPISQTIYEQHAPTLRGLLERTK